MGDEASGGSLWVSLGEVVPAGSAVEFAVSEHVPGGDDHGGLMVRVTWVLELADVLVKRSPQAIDRASVHICRDNALKRVVDTVDDRQAPEQRFAPEPPCDEDTSCTS